MKQSNERSLTQGNILCSLISFAFPVLLALFLQFVCCRTGSLLCAICAHALYNALSVCLLLFCFRS